MPIQAETLEMTKREALTNLHNAMKKIEQFKFPEPKKHLFKSKIIYDENEITKIPTGIKGADYIYFFKVVGKEETNRNCYDELEQKKLSNNNSKDFPKLNVQHKGTQYLYVGRSQKLRQRIRQHLGKNHKGTYAMHMERWCKNLKLNIEFQYFEILNSDNVLVQSIEDALWDKLKPCFGRKGAK
jgi:hypothetical protein